MHDALIPSTVLIKSDGTFKIADFGLSRVLEAREETAHSIVGLSHYF
jgi:serine/threonine protein kinase